jgi:hypothetical protein
MGPRFLFRTSAGNSVISLLSIVATATWLAQAAGRSLEMYYTVKYVRAEGSENNKNQMGFDGPWTELRGKLTLSAGIR